MYTPTVGPECDLLDGDRDSARCVDDEWFAADTIEQGEDRAELSNVTSEHPVGSLGCRSWTSDGFREPIETRRALGLRVLSSRGR